jgi:uncharacterized protein YaaN involved in tellurite resistance
MADDAALTTTQPAGQATPVRSPDDIDARSRLNEERLAEARKIASALDLNDSTSLLQFAVESQKDMTSLTDPILQRVATKDTGPVGETLSELMERVKEIDSDSLTGQANNILKKLPIVGGVNNEVQKFINRYEKVATKIDRITDDLRDARQGLLSDINWLDAMSQRNAESFQRLLVYIAAGELKLEEVRAEFTRQQAEAIASGDIEKSNAVAALGDQIASLERRVYDLKLTAMISLQTAPQIRLVQAGDKALVEKIQSSILTTIPLWKNAIVIAIALYNQKKALELQRAVTDTTNELLLKNAAMLQQGVTDVARETERGIVEMQTLKTVNDQLIATINETIKIQQEGHQKRMQAETQLQEMQKQLGAALTQPRGIQAPNVKQI